MGVLQQTALRAAAERWHWTYCQVIRCMRSRTAIKTGTT